MGAGQSDDSGDRQTVSRALSGVSGVYQIRCIATGKIYVGSAVDLWKRWGQHVRRLRRGKHRNKHLQHAWNKYGEAAFEFEVLELVDAPALLQAEQAWIDRTGCADRNSGFNVYCVAGSPADTHSRVWEGFIDPDGNEVTITNLHEFCRANGLDNSSMLRLASGKSKLKSYKGWTHRNSPRQREYVKTYDGFVDPEGRPAGSITNLAAFCREHGLDKTHMVALSKGRVYSYKGWTYDNDRQRLGSPKTYTGFRDPHGKPVVITNLQEFCREHGLSAVHMHQVKASKRKSHKGWTWSESDES